MNIKLVLHLEKIIILQFISFFTLLVRISSIYSFTSIRFTDPVEKVTLSSSNLQRTIEYWKNILRLRVYKQEERKVLFGYGDNQAKLEFEDIGKGRR